MQHHMRDEPTVKPDASDALIMRLHLAEDAFLPLEEGGSTKMVLSILNDLPSLVCDEPRASRVCLQRLIRFGDERWFELIDSSTMVAYLNAVNEIVHALFAALQKPTTEDASYRHLGSLAEIFECSKSSRTLSFLGSSILCELSRRVSLNVRDAFVLELMPMKGFDRPPSFETLLVTHFGQLHQGSLK